MNKVYSLASFLLMASAAPTLAQGTELFFSEYDEGAQAAAGGTGTPCPNAPTSTGNEKALEIYNPTINTVDLSKYSVRRYSNGSLTVVEDERIVRASGPNQLAPSTPYVFANTEATLPEIRNAADQFASMYQTAGPNVITLGGPIYFNGDDAMALVRWTGAQAGQGTAILVDLIGIVGHDPGTQWSGLDNGGNFVATANQSLRRRPDVSGGSASLQWNLNTNPGLDPTQYNPGTEWESYSQAFPTGGTPDPCAQSYSDLGIHNYTGPNGTYAPLGLLEDFNNAISFYPNPAHGRVNVSLGAAKVGMMTILNGVGKSIVVRPGAAESATIDVSSLVPGLYFVKCVSADGKLTVYKELVVQ